MRNEPKMSYHLMDHFRRRAYCYEMLNFRLGQAVKSFINVSYWDYVAIVIILINPIRRNESIIIDHDHWFCILWSWPQRVDNNFVRNKYGQICETSVPPSQGVQRVMVSSRTRIVLKNVALAFSSFHNFTTFWATN